ncbi:hypothetical protein H6F78_12635 [Coleofasciculus sp. FACHB-64]|uniref:DUF7682 family zinc-binding protein n=1 Tax=Cyanophyceae TaxID=3028117 RepID=UPI0016853C94|nr:MULTISPECIES: hypothetical protein [unclassified Coleofasciculus]MBD1840149.1 hypothetical protein [Coleofasciculus sp. FACHB-501]MBD1882020.1 hypothetical protein [Coleofasciculus sp. FACHB-T130]MBD1887753.1 hypothetical protein [Coleofasciculus sp. FACHB-SPT9]MBD1894308.1 hypothetical protein [Coleofasciculus sp. FACHB-129]MBD1901658.1 hypothetical protein [Coleofasciculus sp. FACHB-125]
MPTRKKTFSCGHKGHGQTCHRCVQERATWIQRKQEKQEWEESFSLDPINLRHLPAHLVVKARAIIARLEGSRNYIEFRGKRMRHNRLIISIPLSRDYRMICRDCGTKLVPEEVMSHEEYNVCKPGS